MGIDGPSPVKKAPVTMAIVSELDGMNKYLQGVKLPQALDKKGTSPYTMKTLQQDTRTMNQGIPQLE